MGGSRDFVGLTASVAWASADGLSDEQLNASLSTVFKDATFLRTHLNRLRRSREPELRRRAAGPAPRAKQWEDRGTP